MNFNILVLFALCFQRSLSDDSTTEYETDSIESTENVFQSQFTFGVGTSAYQIEGAWNVSGKSPSIWDYVTHYVSSAIADGSNGDVACNSYYKLDDDIKILKELGVNHYRFSISWARLLPTGYRNEINQNGVHYYNSLIDSLLENNIEPWVTIYHWDNPYSSFVIGGFLNAEGPEMFAQYADLVFELFGDRVKTWITINEPYNICNSGLALYGSNRPYGITEYICSSNILKAHAYAVDIYNKKYRRKQKGKLSMAFSMQGLLPASESDEDIEATQRVKDFMWGWFLHPCIYGDYPQVMKDQIARYSEAQGFVKSRLVALSRQDRKLLKKSIDFIGLNNYDTWLVEANGTIDRKQSYSNDLGANIITDPGWNTSTSLQMKAKGLGVILEYIRDISKNMEIRICEQGIPDSPGTMYDTERHTYLVLSLRQLLKSISEGINVTAYTFWSLMDNFEWTFGYTVRYGLYNVDFNDEDRPRRAKLSASTFKQIAAQKSLAGLKEIYDEL